MKILRACTVPISILGYRKHFEYLEEKGLEICITTTPDDHFNEVNNFKVSSVIPLSISREIHLFQDIQSIFSLYFLLYKEKPDILHSNTPKASIIAALAGFLARVPVRVHTFTGQRWITLTGPKRKLLILIDRLVLFLNTKCLADSPSQASFLNETFKPKAPVKCLGKGSFGGVDLDLYDLKKKEQWRAEVRKSLGLNEHDFVFLFLGRVCKDKGIEDLLDAFKLISKKESRAKLVICGPYEDGSNKISNDKEELMNTLPGVTVCGYTNEAHKYYASAEVLVLPSHREGFGSVVLEAGALEVPTIGSDIYGVRDAILDNKTGLLFKKESASDLYDKMVTLLEDESLLEKLSRGANQRVSNDFSVSIVGNDLIDFYKSLVK